MTSVLHLELKESQNICIPAGSRCSEGALKMWDSLPGDRVQLANTSCPQNWTSPEELGFLLGSLLFPGDYQVISKLIRSRSAGQVQQMAIAEHPEALRLQREVEKLRQRNSFKDADFRHGSLLQNVMGALSPFVDQQLEVETEQVIKSFIKGDLVLKELLVFLSDHFSLSIYLRALLSSRQNAGDNGSSSGSHISRPWCEPPQEKQAWEQPSQAQEEATERTEMAQRKVKGKCKVKMQKDKDAEKRELEPLCCLNCGVRWAPMPRQGMCNACGIYLTNNKRHRPLALAHKLQRAEPWKFMPSTPPGHVLKKKDNGKTVAVPLEDLEGGAPADHPGRLPVSRPVSAAGMTAEEEDEEADAVRRSNRQRRPPVHLSEDDYPASDAEPASEADKATRIVRKLHAYPGAPTWPGALSDGSDQSCYEDEEMYEAELPLDNEEVKALYSHTAWESPQDDPFAAESLLYLRHSKTPVKARKRMYEEMEQEADPAQDSHLAASGFMQAPAEPAQAFAGGPKRFKERRKPKNGGPCTNCSTTMSSMWRPHNSKFKAGPTRCNACGIYVTSYGMERPVDEHGNLDKAAAKRVSSSRANSRKRICRENSTGSDATGQGLAPSHSGSLPAALAPYVPVPSAFAPKAAPGPVFNISVDASGGAQLPPAMLFENSHTPSHRIHHLARQISAAGSGTLQRALFATEKPIAQTAGVLYAPAAVAAPKH